MNGFLDFGKELRHPAPRVVQERAGLNGIITRVITYDAPLRHVMPDQTIYDAASGLPKGAYKILSHSCNTYGESDFWSVDVQLQKVSDWRGLIVAAPERLHFQSAIAYPDTWLDQATELLAAAKVLYRNADFERNRYYAGKLERWEHKHWKSGRMIASYAIENALKGIIIWKTPSIARDEALQWRQAQTGHELTGLVKEAEIALSPSQRNLMETLEKYAMWKGRYPVKKKIVGERMEYNQAWATLDSKVFYRSEYKAIERLATETIFPILQSYVEDVDKLFTFRNATGDVQIYWCNDAGYEELIATITESGRRTD